MGSGHFLVAALDRIEARLSAWLSLHPVPAVTAELTRLRDTAFAALGDLGAGAEIETGSLLRRQVARHCVYGVDRNRVAVELARLSIWVHTFVPGLPLSLLDHNLICGDSLTGVGTLDEAVVALDPNADPNAPSLFRSQIMDWLARAEDALRRLARTSDATKKEIDEAREAHRDAQAAVIPARALFDLVTAHRAGSCPLPEKFKEVTFLRQHQTDGVTQAIQTLQPVHFPSAFPEVFVRENAGFNCLLGNPPWEKVKVERQVWWGQYLPGIRSLGVSAMNAEIDRLEKERSDLVAEFERAHANAERQKALIRASFPDIGAGDTDLYQAFSWRNWQLAHNKNGHIGIVLPRTALVGPGNRVWRQRVLESARFDATVLVNNGGWVFDDVPPAGGVPWRGGLWG